MNGFEKLLVTGNAVFSLTVALIVNVITLSFIPCGAVISELVGEAIFIPYGSIIFTFGDGWVETSNDAALKSTFPSLSTSMIS